ncbi:MAG TPA: HD domain-containing protein [Bryobacteraceae bacterium]|nr:HD domain-containing protein [Bryobacteraceae bacterium]
MIFDAVEFAAAAHRGQYRKGTLIPYLMHPLAAARTVIVAGCPEHVAAAAILHDVIEDTCHTIDDIRGRFGDRVAALIHACTEPNHRDASWEERKQHTVDTLASTTDQEILMVAIADKLDNIRSIREDLALRGELTWTRFKRGREKQAWYYRSLSRVFGERMDGEAGRKLATEFEQEVRLVFDECSIAS